MKERLREALERCVHELLAEAGFAGDAPVFAARSAALGRARRLRLQRRAGPDQAAAPPPREIAEQLAATARRRRRTGRAHRGRRSRLPERLARRTRAGRAGSRISCAPATASRRAPRPAARRVQVEFVSANPTGPLTLGHGRQAVIGDCIARLLAGRRRRRHARVLLQRRRPPDARARRVGEGALPGAARPRRRAAGRRCSPTPSRPGPTRSTACRSRSRATATRASTSTRSPPSCARSTARRSWTSPATACSARPRRSASSREIEATLASLRRRASTSTPTRRPSTRRARSSACSPTCARRTSSTTPTAPSGCARPRLGLDRDRVLVKSQRRADLPAARHRLPPRQVRARLRPRDRRAGRRPHRAVPVRARGDRRARLRRAIASSW